MTRHHQHYHAHSVPGQSRITICWAEGTRSHELLISGTDAAAILQRLAHAPDEEHRQLLLSTVIEGWEE